MRIFKCYYQGINKRSTTYIFAKNMQKAIEKAHAKSLLPIKIQEINFISHLGHKNIELENIFWQLSFGYGCGLDLIVMLESIRDDLYHKDNIELLESMLATINKGEHMSKALKQHSDTCGSLVVALFEIGEKSGNLKETCSICAKEIAEKNDFNASIKKALIYPCILLFAFMIVFIIISIFVIPEFISIYDSLGSNLPFITQCIIITANIFSNYLFYIIPLFLLIIIASIMILRIKIFRDKLIMIMPVINKIILDYELYRYFLSLYYLLKSGVPFDDSVTTCNDLINNLSIKNEFLHITDLLHKGIPLSKALMQMDSNINIANISLLQSGEKSGKLDLALELNANFYKKKYNQALDSIHVLIEPIATIIVGIFILCLTLGVVSPMWKLLEVAI